MKFDRSMCVNLQETISREWLITNGVGGYAAGTIAGMQTRREHGLLVASARECSSPQLLLSKIDEEIVFDQRTYYLGTNEYRDGALNPAGYVHLESFRLEEGFPVFTYHLGGIDGIVLEKRIWMPQGLNTTYIHYRVVRTTSPEHADYHCARSTTSAYAARFHADVHAAQRNLSLTLLPLTAHRPASELQHGSEEQFFEVETQHIDLDNSRPEQRQSIAGCTIHAGEGARPYHIFAVGHAESQTTFLPTGVWYWNFLHRADKANGREAADDLYLPGVFRTTLWPGDDAEFTIIITAEDLSWQMFTTPQLKRAYADAIEYQRSLSRAQRYFGDGGVAVHAQPVLPVAHAAPHEAPHEAQEELTAEEFLHTLFQASNRFLCARTLPLREQEGNLASFLGKTQTIPTIVSGFYDMEESTRDTLIALPGLTLATGRYAEARRILSNLSRTFSRGLLPDHLPTEAFPTNSGNESSLDTTLWFFYALDAYLRATSDYDLLDDLFERLEESIAWLVRGTAGGIGVDARDGLLQASLPGNALTWMNAFDGDMPVTPRAGKPVEANALWYNALSLMQEWSGYLRRSASINHSLRDYEELRQQCKQSFNQRFWYNKGSYLYDVIDGPRGDDMSLRPNQLFALSLRYPVLDTRYWPGVMQAIRKHLLTPFGLRSLAPHSEGYIGRINEQGQLQRGLHSGGAWPWLFGAYIDALFAMHETGIDIDADEVNSNAGTQRDTAWRAGVELLTTFRKHLSSAMLGYVASVYDGDDPQLPHGQLASAYSTGELLRIYKLLAHTGIRLPDRELPVA